MCAITKKRRSSSDCLHAFAALVAVLSETVKPFTSDVFLKLFLKFRYFLRYDNGHFDAKCPASSIVRAYVPPIESLPSIPRDAQSRTVTAAAEVDYLPATQLTPSPPFPYDDDSLSSHGANDISSPTTFVSFFAPRPQPVICAGSQQVPETPEQSGRSHHTLTSSGNSDDGFSSFAPQIPRQTSRSRNHTAAQLSETDAHSIQRQQLRSERSQARSERDIAKQSLLKQKHTSSSQVKSKRVRFEGSDSAVHVDTDTGLAQPAGAAQSSDLTEHVPSLEHVSGRDDLDADVAVGPTVDDASSQAAIGIARTLSRLAATARSICFVLFQTPIPSAKRKTNTICSIQKVQSRPAARC